MVYFRRFLFEYIVFQLVDTTENVNSYDIVMTSLANPIPKYRDDEDFPEMEEEPVLQQDNYLPSTEEEIAKAIRAHRIVELF